jgi:L-lactate dehydrogenase
MKIGIVGTGLVGSTAAYALVMQGIGRQIVLVDKNEARAQAEAADLLHAVPFAHPLRISAGGYADLAGARVVVISAGVGQRPGETRLQLLERNAAIFRELVPAVCHSAPDAVLVVATNPVDIMTHLAARYADECGFPVRRVVGSGTMLDTARFRTLLAEHLDVDAHHVHAYVIGEHGDSEVLTWSLVTVGGMPLQDFCKLREICGIEQAHQEIDRQVRQAAYTIIQGKGATYYGVGAALARLVGAILFDQRAILTVSSLVPDLLGVKDVTVSLPHLVSGDGVISTFPLPLSAQEEAALRASAQVIRQAIDDLDAPQS